jgi:hypothetical protein
MGLIKKNVDDRPIRTAPELGERISAIFPEACRDKMIASGSITLSVK